MADESRPARLRDFLYVDVDRVRGLLAQLDGGAVDQVVERHTGRGSRRLAGGALGLSAGIDRSRETSVEQTRSTDDALFSLFEEAAELSDALRELPQLLESEAWWLGEDRQRLQPGQLIRVTGATQIVDPPHVRDELIRTLTAVDAFARFEEAVNPTSPPMTGSNRSKLKPKDLEDWQEGVIDARIGALLDLPVTAAVAVGTIIEKLLGESISVRMYPCGPERRELVMSGALSDLPGTSGTTARRSLPSMGGGRVSGPSWLRSQRCQRNPCRRPNPTASLHRSLRTTRQRVN